MLASSIWCSLRGRICPKPASAPPSARATVKRSVLSTDSGFSPSPRIVLAIWNLSFSSAPVLNAKPGVGVRLFAQIGCAWRRHVRDPFAGHRISAIEGRRGDVDILGFARRGVARCRCLACRCCALSQMGSAGRRRPWGLRLCSCTGARSYNHLSYGTGEW